MVLGCFLFVHLFVCKLKDCFCNYYLSDGCDRTIWQKQLKEGLLWLLAQGVPIMMKTSAVGTWGSWSQPVRKQKTDELTDRPKAHFSPMHTAYSRLTRAELRASLRLEVCTAYIPLLIQSRMPEPTEWHFTHVWHLPTYSHVQMDFRQHQADNED